MCYSAQIKQLARRLVREFGVYLDYEAAERIFLRRLDDPSVVISRGFEANFYDPHNATEARILDLILEHRKRTASTLEADLFKQKTRLTVAARKLAEALANGNTRIKSMQEEKRKATNNIASLTRRLGTLHSNEWQAGDDRIFAKHFAGVIVRKDGRNVLTPMRYLCRPAGMPASFDKTHEGAYNARRDNIERFWTRQFGATHALAVFDSFFENVQREVAPGGPTKNAVLHFVPTPPLPMLIACIHSHWSGPGEPDLDSWALITDEPPPEIAAAGHDRCPINLKPENAEEWLTPQGRTRARLQAILDDRQRPYYAHEVLAA